MCLIISSARSRSESGNVMPSVLAAFMLRINLTFVPWVLAALPVRSNFVAKGHWKYFKNLRRAFSGPVMRDGKALRIKSRVLAFNVDIYPAAIHRPRLPDEE